MEWRVSDYTSQRGHRQNALKSRLYKEVQQKILPSQEALKPVKQVTDKLIKLLQRPQNKFKVDRCAPGGSYGKKTTTCLKVDLDIVVFISTKEKTKRQGGYENLDDLRMRNAVFDEWKSLIKEDFKLKEEDFSGVVALTFQLDGIDIDLVPAPSFYQNPKMNAIKVYELMSLNSDKTGSAFSAALTEVAIKFVKEQPAHVNDLCRLTKFWQNGVLFEDRVDGRSFLFECLSIYTVREMPNDGSNLVEAFCCFLEFVIDFQDLVVAFPEVYEEYIGKVKIETPGLYLPFNPYESLTKDLGSSFYRTFADAAKDTLRVMIKYINGRESLVLQNILMPWHAEIESFYRMNTINIIMGWDPNLKARCGTFLPILKYRDSIQSRRMYKSYFKQCAAYLILKELDYGDDISNRKTCKFVNSVVQDLKINRNDSLATHEAKDVTFVFPCRHTDVKGGFLISFQTSETINISDDTGFCSLM